ncbi:MAG: transcriptional regulator, Crp/Fnr family [Candidatus Saccharibacteria bacterium]|nr:transcriptional regulator, Crp/Fnr family [Candidatus Saccharibacteria bacterium]
MSVVKESAVSHKYILRKFFELGDLRSYEKGDWICGNETGACDFIHYIKYGYVKAYSETDKEHVHIIFDVNEIFPILKLDDSQDRRVRYGAISKVKIYNIHRDHVIQKIKSDLAFSNSVLASVLSLYRVQADRVDNLEHREAYQRVVNRILFLVARFGVQQEDGSYVLSRIFTHKLIANTLNLSRESVSREIMQLQELGLLMRSPGGMLITDIHKLAVELNWPISSNMWGLLKEVCPTPQMSV